MQKKLDLAQEENKNLMERINEIISGQRKCTVDQTIQTEEKQYQDRAVQAEPADIIEKIEENNETEEREKEVTQLKSNLDGVRAQAQMTELELRYALSNKEKQVQDLQTKVV